MNRQHLAFAGLVPMLLALCVLLGSCAALGEWLAQPIVPTQPAPEGEPLPGPKLETDLPGGGTVTIEGPAEKEPTDRGDVLAGMGAMLLGFAGIPPALAHILAGMANAARKPKTQQTVARPPLFDDPT